MEYYSATGKEDDLPFVTTWMDLEPIMLSEVSDRERQELYDVLYMSNLKKSRLLFVLQFGVSLV